MIPDVHPLRPQLGGVRVPQAVGVDALGDAGLLAQLAHEPAHVGPPQLAARPVAQERRPRSTPSVARIASHWSSSASAPSSSPIDFVAAELSRLGYIASITLRNAEGIDIIAANATGTRAVSIQVKTNQYPAKQWMLGKKAEDWKSENYFYVFVNLPGPEYHVVPSATVAARVSSGHESWLAGARRDGSPRKDSSIRIFADSECKFRDAWRLLGLGDPHE